MRTRSIRHLGRRAQSALTQIELWPTDESPIPQESKDVVIAAINAGHGLSRVEAPTNSESAGHSPDAVESEAHGPRLVDIGDKIDQPTEAPTSAALTALRGALQSVSPLVVEHDWDGYFAYGAPRIFAYVWPHATHVTLGLLQGSRLRPTGSRLIGRGPALRTVAVRSASEVDPELKEIISRVAERAVRDGVMR